MAIQMDKKVEVKNLSAWPVYFSRREGTGDIVIQANGVTRLTVEEIQSQVYAGNKMFNGEDGKGSNARLYVDDKETRIHLEFETETEPQKITTEKEIKAILALKTQKAFEEKVKAQIVTEAEKVSLIAVAQKTKLNDYDKIQFIEEFTGKKYDFKIK